ncbi:uncharacterized protein B0T15DRAFT_112991 [Chaetomium strumarium]|uniref:Chromo domain-containing protein n=1 Tax=Chaetomium strumarium TaxID=1170767 RepID=A0AAJ0GYQ1_9PEZI|nr:hypothetical protein B0T15DRAFT_112991 [Chaetomium strumarium]
MPSRASKSTKSKRRKSAARESPVYEVRDIIDEKVFKGKLHYKIDWADNPITGEPYPPSWEPAEYVSAVAVADWEREKRRRQGLEPESSSGATESDPQPVLTTSERAKRRRSLPATEGEESPQKRSRESVDSGYTSSPDTGGAGEGSWASVQSIPRKTSEIICEIPAVPDFNRSEYRIVSLPKSAPSLQANSSYVTAQNGEDNLQAGGRISQRTIPDSQGSDSLHTQSTAGPTTDLIDVGAAQEELDQERPASDKEVQTSRSDLDIPSRQPEAVDHDSAHSTGLCAPSSTLEQPEESSWGEGFLTQPEYEPPVSLGELESSHTGEVLLSNETQTGDPHKEQEQSPEDLTVPGSHSLPSVRESHSHSQAAQRILLPESNPGGFLTQVSVVVGSPGEQTIPDTVQKAPRGRSTDRHSNPGERSPRGREGEELGFNRPESTSSRLSTPAPKRNNAPLLSTPQNQKMDSSTMHTPLSAVDMIRQLQAEMLGTAPDLATSTDSKSDDPICPSPAGFPAREQPPSAAGDLNQAVGTNISIHDENVVMGGHSIAFEHPPATVAPADLTTSIEHISGPDDGVSTEAPQLFTTGQERVSPISAGVEPPQVRPDVDGDEQEDDSLGRHFTVTLPMAANTRAIYLDAIKVNRATMIKFGDIFANSDSSVPDASLVAKMDAIFERLLNLCDLPAYDDSLPQLNKDDMMKHATNSNSKFSFVYEFLSGLWDINARALILSQPGRVFDYIEAVVSAANLTYSILGNEGSGQPTDGASVILAVAGQDLSKVQGGVDVVIAFDQAARSVELPATLAYESMAPIVLSLVATYSLEHIDQQLLEVEQDLDVLERKNALNLATAAAVKYLRDPAVRRYPEPHEAAKTFADFLRNPENGLDWEPHPLPADIFEIWLSSQERTQDFQEHTHQADVLTGSVSRKRHLDHAAEGIPKRPKLLLESQQPSRNTTPARMSDLLKMTLDIHPVDGKTTQVIQVPVEQLERMAERIAELEGRLTTQSTVEAKLREQVSSLESQLQSHVRTVQSLQPKFKDAIRDRANFEKECKAAVDKANAATERFEAQKAEIEALKEKNKLLESKVAETNAMLEKSSVPEVAKLAQAEIQRAEAVATVEKLEKKVRLAEKEAEYSRKAYQDASHAHSELNRETQELRSKIGELERRAGENLLKIHQIQAQNEMAEVNRQVDELRAMLDDRERELERAKEELKVIRNGRRETRQGSVPRSPRLGVMSPRPGRVIGGAGSRGTSPAPLISSDGPTGAAAPGMPNLASSFFPYAVSNNGGRWNHLRD